MRGRPWLVGLVAAARTVAWWLTTRQVLRHQRRRLAAEPLFAECTRRELMTLLRWGDEVVLPRGVTVWRQNAIGNSFVVVLAGRLRLTRGRRRVGVVERGDWTGEVAVLGFGPQPATVTTETECELFVLGARALLSYAATLPGLRARLFPGLNERQAVERIRAMRAEGLPQWRELRRAPPRELGPRPEWLRVYPTRRSRGAGLVPAGSTSSELVGTRRLASQPLGVRGRLMIAGMIFAAVVIAALTIPVPYYTLRGNLRAPDVSVASGAAVTYPPRNPIMFPVVDVNHDTALEAMLDRFDAEDDVTSSSDVEGGQNAAERSRANFRLMTQSKHSAIAAALPEVGDNRPEPADVVIDTGELGGPSGGLAFALSIIDLLTPGELTGGHRMAATGTIAPDGSIGPVGGMRLKALAAARARLEYLLVPLEDVTVARDAAGPVTVIGVDSLDDALQFLRSIGGY